VAGVRSELNGYTDKIEMHTNRLDQTINDSKFWLETYTKSFKDNAQQIAEYRLDLEGRIDALMFQLNRRPTSDDMTKNFKRLNDVLLVKFKQLEDIKTGLRDVIAYQKYFYPVQIQNIIGENFAMLDAAQKDMQYVQYQ
jgi:hypothetical protein